MFVTRAPRTGKRRDGDRHHMGRSGQMTAFNPQTPGKNHEDHHPAILTSKVLTEVTGHPGAAGRDAATHQGTTRWDFSFSSDLMEAWPRALRKHWHPRGTGCRSLQRRQDKDVLSHKQAQAVTCRPALLPCSQASGRRGHSNVDSESLTGPAAAQKGTDDPNAHSLTDTRENQGPQQLPSPENDAIGGPATPGGHFPD